MSNPAPISAVLPAFERRDDTLRTLAAIQACDPPPSELIIHIDGNRTNLAAAIHAAHPKARILINEGFAGPGGARNKLIAAASHELVANFDDDSCPDHSSYFARALRDFEIFPDAAVISAASMKIEKEMPGYMHIGIFSGCGCVFRKSWFLKTTGYVPLRIAYCMEEVDLSLRLHAIGGTIIHDPDLHVRHFRELQDRPSAEVNAHVLANTALMPFLRYPLILWPLGVWHVLSRLRYIVRNGWLEGLWDGLRLIPVLCFRHRKMREPVNAGAVLSWMRLRRRPELVKAIAGGKP